MGKKTYKNKKNLINYRYFFKSTAFPIILFFTSIFILLVTFISGENLWFYMQKFILGLFGIIGSVCFSVFIGSLSIMITVKKDMNFKNSKVYSVLFLILSILSLCYLFSGYSKIKSENWLFFVLNQSINGNLNKVSGFIGGFIGAILVWLFGLTGAKIINIITIFIISMIITKTTFVDFLNFLNIGFEKLKFNFENLISNFEKKSEEKNKNIMNNFNDKKEHIILNKKNNSKDLITKQINNSKNIISCNKISNNEYVSPPIEFLEKSFVLKNQNLNEDYNLNSKIIVDTLNNFNIKTKVIGITKGPSVTRYELQLAPGVKVSKISGLSDDLSLSLSSQVRIEAPIIGKPAVGIEVPNKNLSMVSMRELIESNIFKTSKSNLIVLLGKDISGNIIISDLSKMPHLLIAGATGSGKSICISSFIISLIYKANPNDVKLILIDPKVVELSIYNGIPHLLIPVITDAKKAVLALSWAVDEMIDRYKIFAETSVRDISSYNELVEEKNSNLKDKDKFSKKLPQIVIIIDELSDLMMVASNQIEDYICRLSQMARASGIHLIIATQRPSVDVVTGTIKANIPSRIAFAVSSQIDSRTILDSGGAEKLLGKGDMLFFPSGNSKPLRIQGCYISDKEINKITKYLKYKFKNINYNLDILNEIEKMKEK